MHEKELSSMAPYDVYEQPSASDESAALFGIGDLDAEQSVTLREWSAQDFANIYVRFRPHLISHARKFLRDETQAEEVVQDAFLYLMTALPELDSELGVLRFLKWKTKMLCIDMIRSLQAGIGTNLISLTEDIEDKVQPLDALERADDAAIIRLALAKLNPRHREALIATMYEEKSHAEAARQMGVGDNAFRQLLFRARASFRQALVGQAEIEGKTVAEILTVAARRATPVRNMVVAALVVGTAAALSPMLSSDVQISDPGGSLVASPALPDFRTNGRIGITQGSDGVATSNDEITQGVFTQEEEIPVPIESANEAYASVRIEEDFGSSESKSEEAETRLARDAFNGALDESLVSELSSQVMTVSETNGQVTAAHQAGLRANFAVDLSSEKVVQYLAIEFESDGQVWKAVPANSLSVIEKVDGKTFVSYAATDFLVGDFSGKFDYVSTSDSVFSRSGIKLELVIDETQGIVDSHVTFLPKT